MGDTKRVVINLHQVDDIEMKDYQNLIDGLYGAIQEYDVQDKFKIHYIESTTIISSMRATLEEDAEEFVEISYCINGYVNMHFKYTDEFICFKQGQVCFNSISETSTNSDHEMHDYTGYSFKLSRKMIESILVGDKPNSFVLNMLDIMFNTKVCTIFEASPTLTKLIIEIDKTFHKLNDDLSKFRLRKLSTSFIYESFLIKLVEEGISDEMNIINYAKELLVSDLSKPPSLKALAKACNTSVGFLQKGFKEYYDDTVYKVLRKERMKKAHILLLTGASVLETSVIVGYSNPSQFSKAFKQEYGYTPKEVRYKK